MDDCIQAERRFGRKLLDSTLVVPIRVLVADAQALFADMLGRALLIYDDIEVMDVRPTRGADVVAAAAELRPDIVVTDYWMPGMEGPEIAAAIADRSPQSRVVLLSWFCGPAEIRNVLQAGASGFLSKANTLDELWKALRRVQSGQSPVFSSRDKALFRGLGGVLPAGGGGEIDLRTDGPGGATQAGHTIDKDKAAPWRRLATLTPHEITVLQLLIATGRREDVAARLAISPRTVRAHIYRMLEKTGARSQVELLGLARDYGIRPAGLGDKDRAGAPGEVPDLPESPRARATVLIADGQPLFSEAAQVALRSFPHFIALDVNPSSTEEVAEAAAFWRPDLILLDYWLEAAGGADAVRAVRQAAPEAQVIVLSWNFGVEQIHSCLEAGAVTFLLKSIRLEELEGVMRSVAAGAPPPEYAGPDQLLALLEARSENNRRLEERLSRLSPRELEVLRLLCRGVDPAAIAERLVISPETVRFHIRGILAKTETHSATEAIAIGQHIWDLSGGATSLPRQ